MHDERLGWAWFAGRALAAMTAVLAVGCDGGSGTSPDAATREQDGGGWDGGGWDGGDWDGGDWDGGAPAEDAGQDAGAADAEVQPDGGGCARGCGASEVCVRGVCVASCGADGAMLEAALASSLTPVANVCRASGGPFDAVAGGAGGMARVYEVATETSGTTTTFTLSRWTLDPAVPRPTPEVVATATHTVSGSGVMVFGPGALAISPDEMRAVFGYTTTESGFVGGIFDVEVGDGTTMEIGAPGNFDLEWIDASRFVVNGLGLEGAAGGGQGLWLRGVGTSRRLVDEMGSASGSVAVLDDVVLAGAYAGFGSTWPDGTEGGRLFVFDRATLLGASAPLSAWDDALARLEGPSTFEWLGGLRLASIRYDASFEVAAIEARALERASGGGYRLGAPEDLTRGATFSGVVPVGDGRMLLVHAGGLLLVEERISE